MRMNASRGFGLAGESPLKTILSAASAAERAGYDSFWLSQPEDGSTLDTLESVARETHRIRLGVGAIPLTRLTPEGIAKKIRNLEFPLDRLRLGIGSGIGPQSLERLRHGVEELRRLSDIEIVVAPLGPKMCRLAGEVADVVLLNWLTPQYAETSNNWIRQGSSAAGRNMPVVASYVRCTLGPASQSRLEAECQRYGSFSHYAAHFERQKVQPIDTTIQARSTDELQQRLGQYERVLDHVVVRAVTKHDSPSEVLELIEGARR